MSSPLPALDLSRSFLPEALAGLAEVRGVEDVDARRALNQIRASSYLHVFDLFETCLADAARVQAARDVDARDMLVPLLRLDAFDHSELFRGFERSFDEAFAGARSVAPPAHAPRPTALDEVLADAAPLSLLVFALHLKLVTQQHYLACVRGDEGLEPTFVKLLKEHWEMECGARHAKGATAHDGAGSLAIQHALGAALPGRVPAALRDYRRIVFVGDDLLRRQSELDLTTYESACGPLGAPARASLASALLEAHRKTFITFGIVNAAFVYAMRSLGPTAPATLAGIVSALSNGARA